MAFFKLTWICLILLNMYATTGHCSLRFGNTTTIILKIDNSPYIFNQSATVPIGCILIIDPGVTLKFAAYTGLTIYGILIANGTQESYIDFKALVGDQRNWNGLYFPSSSTNSASYLNYVSISGPTETAIRTYENNVPIVSHVIIEKSYKGIWFTGELTKEVFLYGVSIYNTTYAIYVDTTVRREKPIGKRSTYINGTPTVRIVNCEFLDNNFGLIQYSYAVVSMNDSVLRNTNDVSANRLRCDFLFANNIFSSWLFFDCIVNTSTTTLFNNTFENASVSYTANSNNSKLSLERNKFKWTPLSITFGQAYSNSINLVDNDFFFIENQALVFALSLMATNYYFKSNEISICRNRFYAQSTYIELRMSQIIEPIELTMNYTMNYWNSTNYNQIMDRLIGSHLVYYYPQVLLNPVCTDATCSQYIEIYPDPFTNNGSLLYGVLDHQLVLTPGYYYSPSGIVVAMTGKLTVLANVTIEFAQGTGILVEGQLDLLGELNAPIVLTGTKTNLFSGVRYTHYSKAAQVKNVKICFYGLSANKAVNQFSAGLVIDDYDHYIENVEFLEGYTTFYAGYVTKVFSLVVLGFNPLAQYSVFRNVSAQDIYFLKYTRLSLERVKAFRVESYDNQSEINFPSWSNFQPEFFYSREKRINYCNSGIVLKSADFAVLTIDLSRNFSCALNMRLEDDRRHIMIRFMQKQSDSRPFDLTISVDGSARTFISELQEYIVFQTQSSNARFVVTVRATFNYNYYSNMPLDLKIQSTTPAAFLSNMTSAITVSNSTLRLFMMTNAKLKNISVTNSVIGEFFSKGSFSTLNVYNNTFSYFYIRSTSNLIANIQGNRFIEDTSVWIFSSVYIGFYGTIELSNNVFSYLSYFLVEGVAKIFFKFENNTFDSNIITFWQTSLVRIDAIDVSTRVVIRSNTWQNNTFLKRDMLFISDSVFFSTYKIDLNSLVIFEIIAFIDSVDLHENQFSNNTATIQEWQLIPVFLRLYDLIKSGILLKNLNAFLKAEGTVIKLIENNLQLQPQAESDGTLLHGVLKNNRVLQRLNSGSYVIKECLYIPKNVTLRIQAGVKIKFEVDASILADGLIVMEATIDDKVEFELYRDASFLFLMEYANYYYNLNTAYAAKVPHIRIRNMNAKSALKNIDLVLAQNESNGGISTFYFVIDGIAPIIENLKCTVACSINVLRTLSPLEIHNVTLPPSQSIVVTDLTQNVTLSSINAGIMLKDTGIKAKFGAIESCNSTIYFDASTNGYTISRVHKFYYEERCILRLRTDENLIFHLTFMNSTCGLGNPLVFSLWNTTLEPYVSYADKSSVLSLYMTNSNTVDILVHNSRFGYLSDLCAYIKVSVIRKISNGDIKFQSINNGDWNKYANGTLELNYTSTMKTTRLASTSVSNVCGLKMKYYLGKVCLNHNASFAQTVALVLYLNTTGNEYDVIGEELTDNWDLPARVVSTNCKTYAVYREAHSLFQSAQQGDFTVNIELRNFSSSISTFEFRIINWVFLPCETTTTTKATTVNVSILDSEFTSVDALLLPIRYYNLLIARSTLNPINVNMSTVSNLILKNNIYNNSNQNDAILSFTSTLNMFDNMQTSITFSENSLFNFNAIVIRILQTNVDAVIIENNQFIDGAKAILTNIDTTYDYRTSRSNLPTIKSLSMKKNLVLRSNIRSYGLSTVRAIVSNAYISENTFLMNTVPDYLIRFFSPASSMDINDMIITNNIFFRTTDLYFGSETSIVIIVYTAQSAKNFLTQSNWYGLRDKMAISYKIRMGSSDSSAWVTAFESNYSLVIPISMRSVICPYGYDEFNGQCLMILAAYANYTTANMACNKLGGKLAIYSQNLINFLSSRKDSQLRLYWTDYANLIDANRAPFVCESESSARCSVACVPPNGECKLSTCVCAPGWSGVSCDVFTCNYNCSFNGECIGANKCKCKSGFSGQYCSISYCQRLTSCSACTADRGCGWCADDKKAMCLPDDGNGNVNAGYECKAWFFYKCTTLPMLNNCSAAQITAFPGCNKEDCCNEQTAGYSKFTCQQCLDYEACFTRVDGAACSVWNNTKCPNGIVVPDYTDSSRVLNTEINEDVIVVEQDNATLYKCPGDTPSSAFVVFSNELLKNRIRPYKIIMSAQSDGIMHQVMHISNYDKYTFLYSRTASIEQVIEYADFDGHSDVRVMDNAEREEYTANEGLLSKLKTYTTNNVYDLSESEAYKCVGNTYTHKDANSSTYIEYTTFIVLPANNKTRMFNVSDILMSSKSSGYLETIVSTSKILVNTVEEKWILETVLTKCGDDSSSRSSDVAFNQSSSKLLKELECDGGQGDLGLYIVNTEALNGSIILGKKSSSFAMQIIDIKERNGYLYFECKPISDVLIDGQQLDFYRKKLMQSKRDLTDFEKSLDVSLGKLSLGEKISKGSLFAEIEAKLGITLKMKIKKSKDDFVGVFFKLSVAMKKELELKFSKDGPSAELTLCCKPFNPIELKRFYINIGPIPIPGSIMFKPGIKIKASVETDDWIALKQSLAHIYEWPISFVKSLSGTQVPPSQSNGALSTPQQSFQPSFSKYSSTEKLKISGEVSFMLGAKWPDLDWIFDFPLAPSFLLPSSSIEYVMSHASISGEIGAVFEPFVIALSCSDKCKLDSLPIQLTFGLDLKIKGSLTILSGTIEWTWGPTGLLKESLCFPGLKMCDSKTDKNTCKCKCPDGEEKKKKPDGSDYCPCDCLDGSIGEQLDNGDCNCTCTCADGSVKQKTKEGCPCKCKCPDCKEREIAADGKCPCDAMEKNCYCSSTTNQLVCDPPPPPPSPPGGGWGDVHFTTLYGFKYDYQDSGEYWFCVDQRNDLAIQVRLFKPWSYASFSLIGGIAVKLSNGVFTLYKDVIRIDGMPVTPDGKLIEMGSRESIYLGLDGKIEIKRKDHSVVTIDSGIHYSAKYYNLYLSLVSKLDTYFFKPSFQPLGLCGNVDRYNVYSFVKNWTVIPNPKNVTAQWSWQYSNFHHNDELDSTFKWKRAAIVKKEITHEEALTLCKRNNLQDYMLESCVFDIVNSGDVTFAQTDVYSNQRCLSACSNHGTCNKQSECECTKGWTGADCGLSVCQETCSEHGKCLNGFCECEIGWTGKTCNEKASCTSLKNCTDENHGYCVESNKCVCFRGYTGEDCSQRALCLNVANCSNYGVCVSADTCECNTGWKGDTCSVPSCESLNYCSNHGMCLGYDYCKCDDFWTGDMCAVPDCSLLKNCSKGGGTCVKPNVCECNPGYTGNDCSLVEPCPELNNCSRNGICIKSSAAALSYCICYGGYKGTRCEIVECEAVKNCSGNGYCTEPNICACREGYTGSDCSQLSCEHLSFCSGNGKCTQNGTCACQLGWYGEMCELANCSKVNSCSNNGLCIKPNVCACFKGYDGVNCELDFDVNNYDPVFQSAKYTLKISEFASVGVSVLQVSASDRDSGRNGRVKYSIARVLDYQYFSIDEDSGVVNLASKLSFVDKPALYLTLTVYDGGIPRRQGFASAIIQIERTVQCNDIFNTSLVRVTLSNYTKWQSIAMLRPSDLSRNVSYFIDNSVASEIVRMNINVDEKSGRVSVKNVIHYGKYIINVYGMQYSNGETCRFNYQFDFIFASQEMMVAKIMATPATTTTTTTATTVVTTKFTITTDKFIDTVTNPVADLQLILAVTIPILLLLIVTVVIVAFVIRRFYFGTQSRKRQYKDNLPIFRCIRFKRNFYS